MNLSYQMHHNLRILKYHRDIFTNYFDRSSISEIRVFHLNEVAVWCNRVNKICDSVFKIEFTWKEQNRYEIWRVFLLFREDFTFFILFRRFS